MTSDREEGETKGGEKALPDLTSDFTLFSKEKRNKSKCTLGLHLWLPAQKARSAPAWGL